MYISRLNCCKNKCKVLCYLVVSCKTENCLNVAVVVQFYPWFKFYFLLFSDMVMYDNEFETIENKI